VPNQVQPIGDYTTIQPYGNKVAGRLGLWYNNPTVDSTLRARKMNVLETVRNEIKHTQVLKPGATIVVGVSGGSDSLCLLHVLRHLSDEYDWSLHVAHLNHCLRGSEADEDMVFVALLALDWDLPCTIEAIDVAAVSKKRRVSLEETSRQVRYGFLAGVAQRVGADAVAVAHQADDQSETVLMHLLRGTGLAGLKGMAPKVDMGSLHLIKDGETRAPLNQRTQLVRPLLSVPRAEIETYCQNNSLSPRFDRSNLDTSLFRNRLRHELLPLLETYNPNVRTLLRRTAAVAQADHDLVETALEDAWAQTVQEQGEHSISFDLLGWRALPIALQRAAVRHAAYQLRPQLRDVGFVHIEDAVEIANAGSTGAQATLPQGLCLTVGYRTLRFADQDAPPPIPDWPLLWHDEPVPVAVPGQTEPLNQQLSPRAVGASRSSGWVLEAEPWSGKRELVRSNPDRWTAYVDADRLSPHTALRRRIPGDRFRPLGMQGHEVELADFMVNAKIPRAWREYVPLFVNRWPDAGNRDEIVWLVGWRIDERAKVTARTRNTLRLRFFKKPTVKGRVFQ
jgi:tRNA(Ile)-lysidine synthetase-like protein